MSKFVTKSFAGIIATALVCGAAFIPAPAEAATLSNADKAALKQATVSCKAEAKGKREEGKKLGWFARRKYVKACLVESLKAHPNIDVNLLYPDSKNMPDSTSKNPI